MTLARTGRATGLIAFPPPLFFFLIVSFCVRNQGGLGSVSPSARPPYRLTWPCGTSRVCMRDYQRSGKENFPECQQRALSGSRGSRLPPIRASSPLVCCARARAHVFCRTAALVIAG